MKTQKKVGEILNDIQKNNDNFENIVENKKKLPKFIKSTISFIVMIFLLMSFIVSAYRIPTGSMERSLRIGDMLLVNKFIYGFRSPDWIGIPFTQIGFDIPWFKTPMFKDVKQGDVVVFKHFDTERNEWVHYVKRCVATAGQTVEIKNKILYVDGKKFKEFYKSLEVDNSYIAGKPVSQNIDNTVYPIESKKKELIGDLTYFKIYDPINHSLDFSPEILNQQLRSRTNNRSFPLYTYLEGKYNMCLPDARIVSKESKSESAEITKKPIFQTKYTNISPDSSNFFSVMNFRDNYGPVKVPKDSYFMMGDNRDNSYDSRYWGFVNKDYIVGKPIMVYFSLKPTIPWSSLFDKIDWKRIGFFIQ